jgi:hypothetical protein
MSLSVDFLAMTNPLHCYRGARIIDIVQDAVNSHADPPAPFRIFQFLASGRPWVFRKRSICS